MKTNDILKLHEENKGKIALSVKTPIKNKTDFSLLYTPGVSVVSKAIAKQKEKVWKYTSRGNWVAIVTDGTAVLGLGDIGPEAALPVMEGKAVLFKQFAGIDAFPICLNTKDPDKIVDIVKTLAPSFGGINLEDISAPRCFYIENRLKKELDIPVFHDDQHGTAIVVLAGLVNAAKLKGIGLQDIKVVISGCGAAGIAVAKILLQSGIKDLIVVDSTGIVEGTRKDLNVHKAKLAKLTNKKRLKGGLKEAIKGRDVFIGVSKAGVLTMEMVTDMVSDPIIFALANPDPEIMPEDAKAAGAYIVATGRSDYPNQVNNVLAFPGVFKGCLKARCGISEKMKLAASYALAGCVKEPTVNNILPDPLEKHYVDKIANAIILESKESKKN
jgi:malate dehydrogenase (oxaloacetate-decarboxylating)